MRNLRLLITGVVAAVLVTGCGVTENGFSSASMQKRKYTKGFYISKNHKFAKNHGSTVTDKVLTAEDQKTTTENNDVAELQKKSVVMNENNTNVQIQKTETISTIEKVETPKTVTNSNNVKNNKESVTEQAHKKTRTAHAAVNVKEQNIQSKPTPAPQGDVNVVILVILALLIPPLAVALYEGITTRFWIDLVLALIGFGVGFWLFGGGLAYLCALVAVIYALLIVLGVI